MPITVPEPRRIALTLSSLPSLDALLLGTGVGVNGGRGVNGDVVGVNWVG